MNIFEQPRIWDGGHYRSPAEIGRYAERLAASLPEGCAVIPDFRDQGRFLACLQAALLRRAQCIFSTDRSASFIDHLAVEFAEVVLATDTPRGDVDQGPLRVVFLEPEDATFVAQVEPADPPFEQEVLRVFTSGSSGTPKSYTKAWAALTGEAEAVGSGLGEWMAARGRHVVSTVPTSHMWGFSFGLFGPLYWGMSIDPRRPVFPQDLQRVLAAAPGASWVVTTPTHLRAYVESRLELPQLAGFICSTAPLAPELAQAVEARFGCPLIENYGSSETGAIAWRRPTEDDRWRCYEGISVSMDERLHVHAPYMPTGGQPVDDRVELLDDGRFRILGRAGDVIKVAGKRASLGDLNLRLTAIPGVRDGAYFMPPTSPERPAGRERLCAFVVAPELTADEIVDALRSEVDPVFLPRPLHLVDKLPRTATGKLPRAALEELWRSRSEQPAATAQ